MINSVTVTNYLGESIVLDLRNPEKSGLLIRSITGLGPVKSDINIKSGSITDGGTFNSARKDTRNIVFDIVYLWTETIEDARHISYKYFPVKKNITLVFETDTRTVETVGYVESNEPEIFSDQCSTQISIICPDPYFHSTGADGTNLTVFSGIENTFEFPFEDFLESSPSLEFGEIHNYTERNVYYEGDAEVGVTITIHSNGEAENVSIYNVRSREGMSIDTDKLKTLTGKVIVNGDEITISTVTGNKRITLLRDGVSYNILNCLDRNTDWIKLYKGDNIFTYKADKGSTNLQFKIENQILYEGV